MPTPYGSRGGMAFSAAELHVLRRSLARALQSSTAPLPADEVQDCLRLARSVDDAVQEAGRLRAFLLADLDRYRDALPGSLSGYLERSLRRRLTTTLPQLPPGVPPAPRTRLLALAGGREEERRPEPGPTPQPKEPPRPEKPIPTPGEVFPPRRKPSPPPAAGLAAG
ncbi:hypothetical protein [Streptomyces sp. ISL-21]|uniref:hypothetical protein n=1 Tax=Streptomyces sp. ISL-21 TaxID=2819179 RepID=UPI001BE8D724|nr:hypothetical protein [Streptomyces sp. ISL-21]MBT2403388.1 hypothetical protein [Streptomyces sp. ISL-21]